jgi:sugar diacid utilization regulator
MSDITVLGHAGCLTVNNPLASLTDHDLSNGSQFMLSLAAWLHTNQDARRASQALGVHPNTLRYRIKRAADLAGLELADPAHRLVTQLVTGATATDYPHHDANE